MAKSRGPLRHSLASSTEASLRLPENSCSLPSKRSKRVSHRPWSRRNRQPPCRCKGALLARGLLHHMIARMVQLSHGYQHDFFVVLANARTVVAVHRCLFPGY